MGHIGKVAVLTVLLTVILLPGITVVTANSIIPWFKAMGRTGDIDRPIGVHWNDNQVIMISDIYPSGSSRIYGSIMLLSLDDGNITNTTAFYIQGFWDTLPRSSIYDRDTNSLFITGRLIRQYPYMNSAFITRIDLRTGGTYWTRIFNASLVGSNAISLEDLCLMNGYVYATGFYMNNIAGNEDMLLVKVNATDGSLVWVKTYTRSNSQELGYGITCADNNIYVLAGLNYNNGAVHSIAVIDFSINGTYKWGREIGRNEYMSYGDIEYGDGLIYTINNIGFHSLLGGSNTLLTAINATNGQVVWNKIENNTASTSNFQPVGGIYYKDYKVYVASYDTDIVNNTFIIYDRLSLAKINSNSTVEWFYALGGSGLEIYPTNLYVVDLQDKGIPVAVGSFHYPGLPSGSSNMFVTVLQSQPVPTVYTWTNGENFSNLTLVDPSTPKNKTIVIPYYGNFTILVKDAWEDTAVANRSIPSSELYPVANSGLQWIPGDLIYVDYNTVYGGFQYHLAIANSSIVITTPYDTVGGILIPPGSNVGVNNQLVTVGTLLATALSVILVARSKNRE